VRTKEWWQAAKLEDFKAMVEEMGTTELEELRTELKAALTQTQTTLETTTNEDQRLRARRALGFMAPKSAYVKMVIASRTGKNQERSERRRQISKAAREAFDKNLDRDALAHVIRWMELFDSK
jgi:hypothetical protein